MAIPLKHYDIAVTYSEEPDEITAYQANDLTFRFTLPGSDTFNGADLVRIELRKLGSIGLDGLLAYSEAATPTGNHVDLALSTAQMNHIVRGSEAPYWLVCYAFTGASIKTIWTAKLALVAHFASATAGPPPDLAPTYLTSSQASALYATLTQLSGKADLIGGKVPLSQLPTLTAPVTSVAGRTGAVTLTKADVALANVDNTSDDSKAVDIAYRAVSLFDPATELSAMTVLDGLLTIQNFDDAIVDAAAKAALKTALAINNVSNTSDAEKPISTATQAALTAEAAARTATDALLVPKTTTINGQALGGNVTVPAAAGTLTGTTLAGNVVSSGLTSVGASLTIGASGTLVGGTNTIEQRNGTAAQTSRLENTYTSATNREYLETGWTSNVAHIWTAKGTGGGTARNLVLGTDSTARMTINATTGAVAFDGLVTLKSFTVATVPAASVSAYSLIGVSNEAGGATVAYSNGSNWMIIGKV